MRTKIRLGGIRMRLIDADKLIKDIKCYFKGEIDKMPENVQHEMMCLVCDTILEHNSGVLKEVDEQPTVNQWIKFTTIFDEETGTDILSCEMPEEDQEILVTDGVDVWMDTFLYDGKGWYLDTNCSLCDEVIAWMPKPQPYKGE